LLARDENYYVRKAAINNPNYKENINQVQARLLLLTDYLIKSGLTEEARTIKLFL